MTRIFLGGTCADTIWRDELIPFLDMQKVEYFNPVVKDWTLECQAIEEEEKNYKCNYHLYVITPEMQGTYSIAEIIHSAHLANMYGTTVDKVIFAILTPSKFEKHVIKSLRAVGNLVMNIAPCNSLVCEVINMEELFGQLFPLHNNANI